MKRMLLVLAAAGLLSVLIPATAQADHRNFCRPPSHHHRYCPPTYQQYYRPYYGGGSWGAYQPYCPPTYRSYLGPSYPYIQSPYQRGVPRLNLYGGGLYLRF